MFNSVDLVAKQAKVSRNIALQVLKNEDGDVNRAMLYLMDRQNNFFSEVSRQINTICKASTALLELFRSSLETTDPFIQQVFCICSNPGLVELVHWSNLTKLKLNIIHAKNFATLVQSEGATAEGTEEMGFFGKVYTQVKIIHQAVGALAHLPYDLHDLQQIPIEGDLMIEPIFCAYSTKHFVGSTQWASDAIQMLKLSDLLKKFSDFEDSLDQ